MSLKSIFDLLDLGLLLWIALMERAALLLERANHTLYSKFFDERTKWYSARNKKAPKVSGGEDDNEMVAVMRESDGDSAEESQPDPELLEPPRPI